MPATKVKRGEKSQFIRSHSNLTAPELVKEAAKQGLRISENFVYNVRANSGKKKKKGKHNVGDSHTLGHGHHLEVAVHFCKVSGGLAEARKTLEVLESLQLG
jgi:hypothetical protein